MTLTPTMQQWSNGQQNPEVVVNQNFVSLQHEAVYAMNPETTSGLTWGYLGGRWGGFSVAAGTLSLTGSSTNYVVVQRSDGVISTSTSNTNWNNTTSYARVFQIATGVSTVSTVQDHRAGTNGVHGQAAAAAGGTIGKQSIYIPAGAMAPSASGGCAALATVTSAANQPDIVSLDFDTTTVEYAQFAVAMPKKWNEGTVTFKAYWSHAATTTNFGVAWSLQGLAVSDDDAIAQAYGTAITVTDTGGTTNDLYVTAESSAVTIAGTPAAEDMVFFRVARETGNGSDNMAIDARLMGIMLYITTDAETDA